MRKNSQGVHLPPLSRKAFGLYLPLITLIGGNDACSFHGADLLIAQPNADGTPLLGSELKLDMSVKDKTLKKPLETKYFDCYEPISPEVSHTNYKLDTFKGGFKDFERINITWMLICCHLVQNKIDCFQIEDFFEHSDTDSEASLVDNQGEFNVEQDAQEEASQDRQDKAGLECNNVLTSSEGKRKRKMPHMVNFQFIPK